MEYSQHMGALVLAACQRAGGLHLCVGWSTPYCVVCGAIEMTMAVFTFALVIGYET